MNKLSIIILILVILLGLLLVAAVPESNEFLLGICYKNVQLSYYRQQHNITDPDWGVWCRQKYPQF